MDIFCGGVISSAKDEAEKYGNKIRKLPNTTFPQTPLIIIFKKLGKKKKEKLMAYQL